jgi:hypothetical protein
MKEWLLTVLMFVLKNSKTFKVPKLKEPKYHFTLIRVECFLQGHLHKGDIFPGIMTFNPFRMKISDNVDLGRPF